MQPESIMLFYTEGGSDKFYSARLETHDDKWSVPCVNGRRGETGTPRFKAKDVEYDAAKKAYDKVVKEKLKEGYTQDPSGRPFAPTPDGFVATACLSTSIPSGKPLESKYRVSLLAEVDVEGVVNELISNDGYWAQEKHDGKRMLLEWKKNKLTAFNRRGIQCGCPSAYEWACANFMGTSFVLDGESVGETYWVFDILEIDGKNQRPFPYVSRYAEIKRVFERKDGAIQLVKSARDTKEKKFLFNYLKRMGREGIVFKRSDAPYIPGICEAQLKYKFTATATCQVIKLNDQASIMIGVLADDGKDIACVGNVTIPANHQKPKGRFVEVRYLHARRGGSLIQPVYLGERDDKTRADKLGSLKFKDEVQEEE